MWQRGILIDTAKTINMMGADVIILRHSMSGAPHLLAKNVDASVINAGDGMNEHPIIVRYIHHYRQKQS